MINPEFSAGNYIDSHVRNLIGRSLPGAPAGNHSVLVDTGKSGGWILQIAYGTLTDVSRYDGKPAETRPDCGFRLSKDTLGKLVHRVIGTQQAFFSGKVKFVGNPLLSLQYSPWFDKVFREFPPENTTSEALESAPSHELRLQSLSLETEERLRIPLEEGHLEAGFHYDEDTPARFGVLLLSPHPALGGDLDNNVVCSLAHTITGRDGAALRLNYRGVGESTSPGSQWGADPWSSAMEGKAFPPSIEDIQGANRWLHNALPKDCPVYWIGYSYGGLLALEALNSSEERLRPKGVLCFCPPLWRYTIDWDAIASCPLHFVFAGDDSVIPLEDNYRLVLSCFGEEAFSVIPGIDHFCLGSEAGVTSQLLDILEARFNAQLSHAGP